MYRDIYGAHMFTSPRFVALQLDNSTIAIRTLRAISASLFCGLTRPAQPDQKALKRI